LPELGVGEGDGVDAVHDHSRDVGLTVGGGNGAFDNNRAVELEGRDLADVVGGEDAAGGQRGGVGLGETVAEASTRTMLSA
jgi:hypothetical protein